MTEIARLHDTRESGISRRALITGALGLTAEMALAACSGETENPRELFADQPTWEQDFTQMPDGRLDESVWNIKRGPNNAVTLHVNTDHPKNLRIQDGQLRFTAFRERVGGREFSSARVDTSKSFAFTYGKLEIDARLSRGAGALDALWMVSARPHPQITTANKNPAAHGEIDIMEHPARKGDLVHVNAHTLATLEANKGGLVQDGGHQVANTSGLHTYGVELSPGLILWTIDGSEVRRLAKPDDASAREWPFDIPHYLIMQLTIGGNFAGEPDATHNQWDMSVAGVRYHPLKDEK